MKSPITAEMTMALMPCLLISTSAITWPAERLSEQRSALLMNELNNRFNFASRVFSTCSLILIDGHKKTGKCRFLLLRKGLGLLLFFQFK